MNKKVFILMLCLVLLVVPLVSALEFDDVKIYDGEIREYVIKNNFGLPLIGTEIGRLQLETGLDVKVPIGYQKVAQIKLTEGKNEYNKIINGIELYDIRNRMKPVRRQIDYKYLVLKEVDKYETICQEIIHENKTSSNICSSVKVGTELKEEWINYIDGTLKEGEIITLGIFANVQEGDKIEWILDVYGSERLVKWAVWTADLNVDLISYFDYNSTDGAILNDVFRHTKNGTLVNTPTSIDGLIEKAINFSSTSSEYVNVTHSLFNSSEITISFWMKPYVSIDSNDFLFDTSGTGRFFMGTQTGGDGYVAFSFNGADLFGNIYDNERVWWVEGEWVHICLNAESGNNNLYINGTLNRTSATAWSGEVSNYMTLASLNTGTNNFNGALDEMAIWNRSDVSCSDLYNDGNGLAFNPFGEVSPTIDLNYPINNFNSTSPIINFSGEAYGINAIANVSLYIDGVLNETNSSGINSRDYIPNETGLIGYWRGDGNADDSSGYGNDGTLTNGANATAIGEYNFSFGLDGIGDSLMLPNSTEFELQERYTLSVWIKPTGIPSTFEDIISSRTTENHFLLRREANNKITFHDWTGGGNQLTIDSNNALSIDEWHHLIVTRNNNTLYLYIDGVLQTNTANPSGTLSYSNAEVYIGSGDGIRYFNGSIDEVIIYNRSLEQAEITELYNAQYSKYNFSKTLTDGNHNWSYEACGTNSLCSTSETRDLFIDSIEPNISVESPKGILDYGILGKNETLNVTFTDTNLEDCWYNYNGTNITINGCQSGLKNSTNFILEDNNFNMTLYANDSIERLSSTFIEWSYSVFEINQTFNSSVTELSSTTFLGQFELTTLTSVSLQYNNTNYSVSINSLGNDEYILSSTITSPAVGTNTNITWFFWINNIKTTTYNQTVLNVGIDNCSTYSFYIINYTLVGELTQLNINNTNSTIESLVNLKTITGQEVAQFSGNFNGTATASVCSEINLNTSNLRLWEQSRYGSTDHVYEQHNIQNVSMKSLPNEITLRILPTTSATTFRISYKSNVFLPVVDAVVNIQRKYIGEGVFKSIESPLTDTEGEASASLDLNAVTYRIVISKNGITLATFENVAVVCANLLTGDCPIILNERSSIQVIDTYDIINDFNYGLTQENRTITLTFEIPSGENKLVNLFANQSTILGNKTSCNQTLFSSNGQLQCDIDNTLGDVYVVVDVSADGTLIRKASTTIFDDRSQYFGTDNIVLTFFLVLSLVLLMISSPITVLIGLLIGLISSSLMLFLNSGEVFGVASVITYLIIIVIILIVKISGRER